MTTLVELCAGSACVSLHALGIPHRLVPYMGGKWPYRAEVLDALGITGTPDRVLLVDAGPWGDTWQALAAELGLVASIVETYAAEDDHGVVWDALRAADVPALPVSRAAVHLTLQRLAFRARPVTYAGNRWKDPGLSKTEAYGIPATETFGAVARQLPTLARRLRTLRLPGVEARRCSAMDVEPIPGAHVYIDPPYIGTTGYDPKTDLTREDVTELARRWADVGCTVVISEAEPVALPGWRHVRLTDPQALMGRKREEWLTCWGKPAQGLLWGAA
jgi:hypothetical protein